MTMLLSVMLPPEPCKIHVMQCSDARKSLRPQFCQGHYWGKTSWTIIRRCVVRHAADLMSASPLSAISRLAMIAHDDLKASASMLSPSNLAIHANPGILQPQDTANLQRTNPWAPPLKVFKIAARLVPCQIESHCQPHDLLTNCVFQMAGVTRDQADQALPGAPQH